MECVEFYSGILIPGMVNAHSHLELSYLKGAIEPGGGFAGFAREMGAVRNNFTEQERLRAIELNDARMWHEGIVAVGDICNGDSTFACKARSPIYYHNFLELFGLNTTSAAAVLSLRERARVYGVIAEVTPHSTYSLNEKGLKAALDCGAELLSIHFMESPGESELYEQSGDLWQWYQKCGFEVDFLGYGSPVERLISTVEPGRKVLLVHDVCTHVDDVAQVEDHFCGGVTWVLCPESNRYISGILPPVEMLIEKGVRIALGTDSLASAWDLSMVSQMRIFNNVPLETRLEWATINGACALGIESWCGSLEVGKRPGIVLLTGVDMRSGKFAPWAETRRII